MKHEITKTESFQETFSSIVAKNPFSTENKFSVINLVTDTVKVKFLSPVVQNYMREGSDVIIAKLKPTSCMKRIRLNFWNEYNKLHDLLTHGKTPMVLNKATALGPEKICHGVCHPDYFYDKFLSNDLCVAYMFLPPENYTIALEECLNTGIERLRQILEFPLYEQVMLGKKVVEKPNTKVADIMIKTFAILDQRLNGAVPKVIHQKVQSETKNVNFNVNNNLNRSNAGIDDLMDLNDLDERISRIRQETQDIINSPKLIYGEKAYVYEMQEKEMSERITSTEEHS